MSEFEYFFSFYGLLLGLTVAEVAVGFANAIDAHKQRPIGRLTPLLAILAITTWMSIASPIASGSVAAVTRMLPVRCMSSLSSPA